MRIRELDNLELFLVKNIYESSSGLGLFTLFKRSKVSSNEFFKSILRLQQKGYVVENDYFVKLTEEGRNFILHSSLYALNDRSWRKVPENFLQHQIDVDEKYTPNIFALDKKMFDFGDDKE